ncbi:aminopeptidase P family protein [bacterium]|nr:aminopeptidase P family protein [bacterium]
MEYYRKRIEKLRNLYPEKGFFFFHDIARTYLTGFSSSEDHDGILIVTPKNAYFFIDARYIQAAKSQIPSAKVILIESYKDTYLSIVEYFKTDGVEEVLIDGNRISYTLLKTVKKALRGIKLKVKPDILRSLRAIKDESEIALISKAVDISELAFNKTLEIIKPGISEADLANELEYQMRKFGGLGPGFDSIVLFGPRTSLPHGVPQKDIKCRDKEIILIDFGVNYEHYTSDITRTFFLGEPTLHMKEVYLTVLRANQRVLDKVKTNMTLRSVDQIARKEIEKSGYGDRFIHSLGHGIGLEIHETPFLSSKMKRGRLQVGMTFTDEPGIYLENEFGVRIEDDIYLSSSGPVHLTSGLKREIKIL